MSAEELPEAAALMRERAKAEPVPVGPWEYEFSDVIRTDVPLGNPGYLIAECGTIHEAHHIASWHPVVALAVADLLEAATCRLQCAADGRRSPYCSACEDSTYDHDCPPREVCTHSADFQRAVTVARAYLGTAA